MTSLPDDRAKAREMAQGILDQAVNAERWIAVRAAMDKCVAVQDFQGAIDIRERAKLEFGWQYDRPEEIDAHSRELATALLSSERELGEARAEIASLRTQLAYAEDPLPSVDLNWIQP
jgi:hypothetical protein